MAVADRAGGFGQALRYDLTLPVGIPAPGKLDQNSGQALTRRRAHRRHVLCAGDQLLERPCDQRLDLSRIEAWSFRLHQHTRRSEIREYVKTHASQRRRAEHRDQESQCRYDTRIGER